MSMYKTTNNVGDDLEPSTSDANYRWETGYEKTWEAITEDQDGTLHASVAEIQRARKRLRASRVPNTKLGMMRHTFIILDGSSSMADKDLHPTRWHSALKLCELFIDSYFDQNPISQLGIVTSSKKRAEKVAELGGNPERLNSCIEKLRKAECTGEFSLQNSLELAYHTLKHVPAHTSKEVIVIMGSLTTCDPSDIQGTISALSQNAVKCSVIGLAAEVRICKELCTKTSGSYGIILDESHFKDLLNAHALPQASATNVESSLIKMGFPSHYSITGKEKPSMCVCHQDSAGGSTLSNKGYICPQCQSKYCELPIECQICGLILVSAPHLARSYHHLFPIQPFEEHTSLPPEHLRHCAGCLTLLKEPPIFCCSCCQNFYCLDCDLFVHEMLHSCPTCSSERGESV
ncbi:general transcription factor IIH subunit 2-like isoform X2 [Watersipora subatra]|uniref:general transcription factor IIH subunit 2-like isoform X2 n=1 Tax=Watersipora subatra TaxID=2589382 RepID=UPI00355B3C0F